MILHDAVAQANLQTVVSILAERPGDINLLDSRRSVLFCAIVGEDISRPASNSTERNATLKTILSRPELSIYALNAAMDCAQGLTPLALACVLGRKEHVGILLDCPSILVDARDASGLTPLMHAVHHRNHKIVSALLRSGARVDLLDPFQRSIFEYSDHPKIRSLLENQLRVDRNPRSTPSSHASLSDSSGGSRPSSSLIADEATTFLNSTNTATPEDLLDCLIRAINRNDTQLLRASLDAVLRHCPSPFSSPSGTCSSHSAAYSIINNSDEFGFSPIHHSMLCRPPNFAIVDALYQAGADVNLLTPTLKTPLQVLVEYCNPTLPEDSHTLRMLVRHLIQDLGASLRYRDDQLETALHLAAEKGACREVLEALVECDSEGIVHEWKNKRGLRPVDIAKPEYRNVFGNRPDSMATVRPLRTKRSMASVSSFSSFTSVSSMASTATVTRSKPREVMDIPIGMSLQEALRGSQILLDEIDLSLLQRTLFYRSSLDLERGDVPKGIDESLSRTSAAVISYWNSCLSLIREELDTIQKAVVKSHLLVARTKREIDQKERDDQRELTQAILVWEEHQVLEERYALKDQARARAFTAPARIPESPSDSDSSQKFWMLPRKWSIPGSVAPVTTIPTSPSETAISTKRQSRVTSFIKQKLRPTSSQGTKTPPSAGPRSRVTPLKLSTLDSFVGDNATGDSPLDYSPIDNQLDHAMHHLSLTQTKSAPSTPTKSISRRPSTATISTRGTVRKAPVVLTRLHTDLLRIEEYTRGIHTMAKEFENETLNASSLIQHCLIRCAQAEENEYEDEIQLERLRSLLLVGLERKVDEMCEALEVVRKWNGLVRSLLREFRRKIKGGVCEDANMEHFPFATVNSRPQTAS